MQFVSFVAVSLAVVTSCQAEVTLTKGVNQTVAFDGDDLLIQLSNPRRQEDKFILCFGSSIAKKDVFCPEGYTGIIFQTIENDETLKLSRKGTLVNHLGTFKIDGNAVFGATGTVNVLINDMPSGVIVTLPNAHVPVSTTTALTSTETTSNKAVIGIIVGVAVFLIIVLIITCSVLLYCCWWKKRSQQPVPTATPNEDMQRTRDDPEAEEPLLPKAVVKDPAAPPPKRASITTTTTKRTTTSTTKPSDEPVAIAPPKPKPKPKTPTVVPVEEVQSIVSLTSDATQPSAPVTPKKVKSKASVRKSKSRKSNKAASTPKPPATPTDKPGSPLLPVDRTQSPTAPSTLPTSSYTKDEVSNARAAASEFKKREYLRRSEAKIPGSTRSRPRSRPVVDEKQEMQLQTETYPCFCERIGTLNNHDHWMIVSRVSATATHITSDAERALLKAAPEDAPALADKVLEEAERRIAPFLIGHTLGWTEYPTLWAMINSPSTPTSDGYIVMYRLMPSLFKLERHSINDPLVRKMPMCGLYILLLDRTLPKAFRVKLAEELRTRASRILPFVQKYQMKETCFPTNYLMLIYNKNQKSFIEKKEIHSKISTKD